MDIPGLNGRKEAAADNVRNTRAQRTRDLIENDQQLRDAMPRDSVHDAMRQPGLRLREVVEIAMKGYAHRPAIGERAWIPVTDPGSGQREYQPVGDFKTITYEELETRVVALADTLHSRSHKLGPGDFMCILGAPSRDYVVVDLACIRLGAVSVPLQTNAAPSQLIQIGNEVNPRCVFSSLEYLHLAIDIVQATNAKNLVVFDYQPQDGKHRLRMSEAQERLKAAGIATNVAAMDELCAKGADSDAPAPPLGSEEDPLATIFYTSGSTGSPKGAMYPESRLKSYWLSKCTEPQICLNYLPFNHLAGRSWAFRTLANGGTCYFTSKSDLTRIFDDVQSVRPTNFGMVPQVCEVIHHYYQGELTRRAGGTDGNQATLSEHVLSEMRTKYLGGRVMSASIGTAPTTRELRDFVERCLDVKIDDSYGTTETGALARNGLILRPPVIEYKLVDVPELGYYATDKPCARGELLVKTSGLMSGYFGRPDLTASMVDDQGFYKTGDIVAEIGRDTVQFLDRRNNVLKLAQGEFVAIAQLEATYANGHPLIQQIYLYGTGERNFLLAVVVPRSEEVALGRTEASGLKHKLREAIQEVASRESLKSYEIPREFLIEAAPFSVANGLLGGVGKYLRPALKAKYGPLLEDLYADIARMQDAELQLLRQSAGHGPILATVRRIATVALGIIEASEIADDASFADLGGDSLSAVSFSLLLGEIFETEVPVSQILGATSSLTGLARHLESQRAGTSPRVGFENVHGSSGDSLYAHELRLDKFINLEHAAQEIHPAPVTTVLLTGGNGYLGRFLLLDWLEKISSRQGKLICIVRGRDVEEATRRLFEVFDGDAALVEHVRRLASGHLEVIAGDISAPKLGLPDAQWTKLAQTVQLIVHPAALVNHVLPYRQLFQPNVVGTANLIELALTSSIKQFNFVSTVAAAACEGGECLDEDSDIRIAIPVRRMDSGYANGYACSKWAAEVLLREASECWNLPVAVFRSHMILAHSSLAGQINVQDIFSRWLYSLVITGIVPKSFYAAPEGQRPRAHYDGLPADFTARAIVALGERIQSGHRTYNVINPHDDGISLDQIAEWVAAEGYELRRIDSYDQWLARFESALRALPGDKRQASSLPVLNQMRVPAFPSNGSRIPSARFREGIGVALNGGAGIPHLSRAFIAKSLADLRKLDMLTTEDVHEKAGK